MYFSNFYYRSVSGTSDHFEIFPISVETILSYIRLTKIELVCTPIYLRSKQLKC